MMTTLIKLRQRLLQAFSRSDNAPAAAPPTARLLPIFHQCDNYSDRLLFWEKNKLGRQLYYEAIDHNLGQNNEFPPAEFLNALLEARSFKAVKQLPILTIAPFTAEECEQFVQWSLRIRPRYRDAPASGRSQIEYFKKRYKLILHRECKKEFYQSARITAEKWVYDKWPNHAIKRNELRLMNLNADLFSPLMEAVREANGVPNWIEIIPIGVSNMTWEIIDTYLFAKAKYEFWQYLVKFQAKEKTVYG